MYQMLFYLKQISYNSLHKPVIWPVSRNEPSLLAAEMCDSICLCIDLLTHHLTGFDGLVIKHAVAPLQPLEGSLPASHKVQIN